MRIIARLAGRAVSVVHSLGGAGLPAVSIALACSALAYAAERPEPAPAMPMPVNYADSSLQRWSEKPILESRLLDDMERPDTWVHHGHGQMLFTNERSQDGIASLRIVSPTLSDTPSKETGRPFGEAEARRVVDREDWSGFNRISFWVYPTLPGFKVISLLVKLHNDGETKVPDSHNREGLHYVLLRPDQWNQVTVEITHLARDKVTGLSLIYRLQGNEPGAANRVCYDFDRLELQRVKPDYYEGWSVAPGRIAYSHTGYSQGSSKTAIASGLDASVFEVIHLDTGRTVLKKNIRKMAALGRPNPAPMSATGESTNQFQVLDFSEVRMTGNFVLRAGEVVTPSFRIAPNLWRDTIWKTINFFYCERCGQAIPGIHDICHRDWRAVHDNHPIQISGGWHDAGDLSQGLVNTAEAAYAMFHLADYLGNRESTLQGRLLEEANWGLDWILKTRFTDGHRVSWATMDFWTDGIVGTIDDVLGQVRNNPYELYIAAATEALAGRLLKKGSPAKAEQALQTARADWASADRQNTAVNLEVASQGVLASLELFRSTGDPVYTNKAFALADVILQSQQRAIMPWSIPLCGFFYTSPKQDRILHYSHRGHEQAPIVALAELCRAFPEHADWMKWYSAVVLHSEYLRKMAQLTDPYGMLPNGVYDMGRIQEKSYQEQLRHGIQLDSRHYLRLFPVWGAFRGNHGTILSQAKALSVAAQLRRNPDLLSLAQNQLQWVVGRNPFSQSTLFGEGYDYAPQYTAMSGDMVGSLPVGIQTRENHDVPYWPASNCYNWKEVWVHPSSRWLWLMSDLYGTGELSGRIPNSKTQPVIHDLVSKEIIKIEPQPESGLFQLQLPEGRYRVEYNKYNQEVIVLPGQSAFIDLREPVSVSTRQETRQDGTVILQTTMAGFGSHRLTARAHNLVLDNEVALAYLKPDKVAAHTWTGQVVNPSEPWVVVILVDGNLQDRHELFGAARLY